MATDFGFIPHYTDKFNFISYNNEDTNRISKVAQALDSKGVPIWYDYGLEYGLEWETQIAEHISKCDVVILFVTKHLFKKEKSYVRKEYSEALLYNKRIIPVFLDEIDPSKVPTYSIGFYVDLTHLHGVPYVKGESPDETANRIYSALNGTSNDTVPQDVPIKKSSSPAIRKIIIAASLVLIVAACAFAAKALGVFDPQPQPGPPEPPVITTTTTQESKNNTTTTTAAKETSAATTTTTTTKKTTTTTRRSTTTTAKKTTTTTKATSSPWMTKDELPSGISSENATIKSKKQYQYSDKVTTVSPNSSLTGWTQVSKTPNYSAWSDQQTSNSAVTESETLKIDKTENIAATYKTTYTYRGYRGTKSGATAHFHYCLTCAKAQYPSRSWSEIKITRDSKLPTAGSWSCGHAGSGTKYRDSSTGRYYYHVTENKTTVTPAYTKYYYRTRSVSSYSYSYSKWTSFSSWSDTVYTASDTRKVNTRLLYSYTPKQ